MITCSCSDWKYSFYCKWHLQFNSIIYEVVDAFSDKNWTRLQTGRWLQTGACLQWGVYISWVWDGCMWGSVLSLHPGCMFTDATQRQRVVYLLTSNNTVLVVDCIVKTAGTSSVESRIILKQTQCWAFMLKSGKRRRIMRGRLKWDVSLVGEGFTQTHNFLPLRTHTNPGWQACWLVNCVVAAHTQTVYHTIWFSVSYWQTLHALYTALRLHVCLSLCMCVYLFI